MRRRPARRLAALATLAVAALAGCSAFSPYAARVNGARISQADLRRELDAILGNRRYLEQVDRGFAAQTGERARGQGNDTFTTVFVAAVLERRIGFELIRQELRRRQLTVSGAQRRQTRENLERSYGAAVFRAFPEPYRDELVRVFSEVTALEEALGEEDVGAAAVKEFYESNPALFKQTCVRHILVDSEQKAAAIKGRVDAGEDFAAIARAESSDNQGPEGGSAAKGGDLGCVTQGRLVPEFEAAMEALQPGQSGGPVQTPFGFHVIQVLERKTQSVEEATPQIRQSLQSQSGGAVQGFITKALARAEVAVNPRYGTFVTSGPNPGVRAPKQLDAPAGGGRPRQGGSGGPRQGPGTTTPPPTAER